MTTALFEVILGVFLSVQGWLLLEIVKLKTDVAVIKTICRERCEMHSTGDKHQTIETNKINEYE